MKTSTIIELYSILSDVKFTGMQTGARFVLLENMRKLKPIRTEFISSMEEAREKLKPEDFDQAREKVKLHNESVQNGLETNRLSVEKLQAFRIQYEQYEQELTERERELLGEDHSVEPGLIPLKDFEKLVEANDIEGGKLELLYTHLMDHSGQP